MVPEAPSPPPGPEARGRARRWLDASRRLLHEHGTRLWWLHSAYALLVGIGVMWLGARHFTLLRIAFLQIGFIWATSLLLRRLVRVERLPADWRPWVRVAVNYVNKNFYQQVLFFILPVYWASTTLRSRQMLFLGVLAVSAVLSTLDVVYDRHLSVRPALTATFFAFNVFACVNVALPVLWGISNAWAMRLSAIAAAAGFATLLERLPDLRRRRTHLGLLVGALAVLLAVEVGRPLVPPAPLRIAQARFGWGVSTRGPSVRDPVERLAAGDRGTLFVVTAIRAPLGLRDRVRHRWRLDGRVVYVSPFYTVTGGRPLGYRLWTRVTLPPLPPGGRLDVEVETEAGQLIGRARLPIGLPS